jgi:hypothetical protein
MSGQKHQPGRYVKKSSKKADSRLMEERGENLTLLPGARSADEIKHMHTILADLTDDELKSITVLPAGSHLQQGAKYIDLRHLEQGEFVATSDMIAGVDTYYVPKKETDYVLWNRLNQIDLPRAQVSRRDFGLLADLERESGGMMLGKDVVITVDAEALLQK